MIYNNNEIIYLIHYTNNEKFYEYINIYLK